MSKYNPTHLMIIGGILLVLGVVFPLLMVIQVVKSTFFLNFLSYIFSLVGTVMGLSGAFTMFKTNRKKR